MSGQKIIDGLQEVIDGKIGRVTEVHVPAQKIFPVNEVYVIVGEAGEYEQRSEDVCGVLFDKVAA